MPELTEGSIGYYTSKGMTLSEAQEARKKFTASQVSKPLFNICLAIGHNFAKGTSGVQDKGAYWNGLSEADVTKKIIDDIISRWIPGFNIVKCPEGLSIDQRNKWVNSRTDKLHGYFEFHLDSATPQATGATTFFVGWNTWSEWEAKQYQEEYSRITWIKSRWVKPDTSTRHWRLWAIRDIKIFWLLMEMWFISNQNDLKTIQSKWIDGVITGIQNMFSK